jgi:glutamate/tyrosine decarboxylase-like PLP-dependent enzyme
VSRRAAPLEIAPEDFRRLGHDLVDRIAAFLGTIRDRPLTPGETPTEVRALLGRAPLPRGGAGPDLLLDEAARLVVDHSLHNGHPRFLGYITSSAAPIGALADLLAAAVNPNVGGWQLAPIASEIEAQTVRWIAELVGYPPDCGGLLVSGGNLANLVCFLAGRRAVLGERVRAEGLAKEGSLRVYVSAATHTWIQKAADLFGLGTDAIRWIPTDPAGRMDPSALRARLVADRAAGDRPLLLVGTAGTVSTGAIDPIRELAAVAREHGIWFHVDGAYGAPAAALPDAPDDLRALALADSLAVDPHKWLYAPLEAGCVLVREAARLPEAFSYTPSYYHFDEGDEEPINFYELGLQNSRGFRALKVWLGLRQAGREGYVRMIADDCRLAALLHRAAREHPEIEALTLGLSIATFRFVPADLRPGAPRVDAYLDALNEELLGRLKNGGRLFVTNAMLEDRFVLRACIVNFRTTEADVAAVPGLVAEAGRAVDLEMRPRELRGGAPD